jgi:ankyrin repeat protein
VAAAAGNAELLPLLINLDILDVPDSSSHTALQLAVQGKWLDAAKVLLDAGASLVALNSTAAPLAIAMEVFVQGGPPQLPLMLLAATLGVPGLAKVVEEAVQRRHRPTNKTALHFAAHAGCTEVVAKLVEAGADRNAVDSWQATPLWCAVWAGHVQLVPLLGTPSNINQPAAGVSPLLAATQQSHLPAVAALLAAGAAVGTDPCSRDSPLATAAAKGHKRMVALLLEALVRECGQQDEQQQGQT